MKKLFLGFISSNLVFFLTTSILILGLNLTPLTTHLTHAPPGRTFTLIHNNAQDFFFYQSLMNEGANGAWLTSDPYTTESHQPSVIFSYFLWLGKVSKILGLPYTITYHLLRIILSIFLLFAVFYLLFQMKIPHPRLAFLFFLFAAPFMHTVNNGGKLESLPYMYWWTGMDPVRRVAYLPHHMFGSLFLVLSIIFILKYLQSGKIKFIIFLIISAALLAFIHTPSLLILLLVIPPAMITLILTAGDSRRGAPNKIFSKYEKAACPPKRTFDCVDVNHEANLSEGGDPQIFIKKYIKYIGISAYWFIGLLFLLLMLSQTNKGFPWSQYIAWEKRLQFPLAQELLGALGILFPFAILGGIKALFSRRFPYIFAACWLFVPILLIPLAPSVNLSNIRLIQGAPYLPLAILAVIGIETIVNAITYKSKVRMQKSTHSTSSGLMLNEVGASKIQFKIQNFIRNSLTLAGDASEGIPASAQLRSAALPQYSNEHLSGKRERQDPLSEGMRNKILVQNFIYSLTLGLFILFTIPTISWSVKDQIREYWPIFGNVYLDNRLQKAFNFINTSFPPKTITLGTFYTGNYLPAYTRTVSYIGHFGYTYNIDEKQILARKFFENKMNDKEVKDLILNNKITLIFQGPEEKPIYQDYLYPQILKPVYDRDEATIYVLGK